MKEVDKKDSMFVVNELAHILACLAKVEKKTLGTERECFPLLVSSSDPRFPVRGDVVMAGMNAEGSLGRRGDALRTPVAILFPTNQESRRSHLLRGGRRRPREVLGVRQGES
jgi:hypothetical protein